MYYNALTEVIQTTYWLRSCTSKSFAGIDTLDDVGCFGLTELGFGNNAVEMQTTAIYDKNTQEWVVNTPNPLAQKLVQYPFLYQNCPFFS